jgi:hypothetical protein
MDAPQPGDSQAGTATPSGPAFEAYFKDKSARILKVAKVQYSADLTVFQHPTTISERLAVGGNTVWNVMKLSSRDQERANAALARGEAVRIAKLDFPSAGPQVVTIKSSLSDAWPALPLFVSEQTLAAIKPDQRTATRMMLARLSRPLNFREIDGMNRLTAGDQWRVFREASPSNVFSWPKIALLISSISVLITLLITVVTMSLHAAEGRRDRAVMRSLGATVGFNNRLAGMTAWTVATLGTVLCSPVGAVAAWIANRGSRYGTRAKSLRLPWDIIGALVIGGPLLAGLVVWFFTSVANLTRPKNLRRSSRTGGSIHVVG